MWSGKNVIDRVLLIICALLTFFYQANVANTHFKYNINCCNVAVIRCAIDAIHQWCYKTCLRFFYPSTGFPKTTHNQSKFQINREGRNENILYILRIFPNHRSILVVKCKERYTALCLSSRNDQCHEYLTNLTLTVRCLP